MTVTRKMREELWGSDNVVSYASQDLYSLSGGIYNDLMPPSCMSLSGFGSNYFSVVIGCGIGS